MPFTISFMPFVKEAFFNYDTTSHFITSIIIIINLKQVIASNSNC